MYVYMPSVQDILLTLYRYVCPYAHTYAHMYVHQYCMQHMWQKCTYACTYEVCLPTYLVVTTTWTGHYARMYVLGQYCNFMCTSYTTLYYIYTSWIEMTLLYLRIRLIHTYTLWRTYLCTYNSNTKYIIMCICTYVLEHYRYTDMLFVLKWAQDKGIPASVVTMNSPVVPDLSPVNSARTCTE